ncbi:MAG: 50S ribosomal protein L17 [Rhodothermales bacterium]|nr:50S ribosomal protein L17 [Rhodothermales bacterium]
MRHQTKRHRIGRGSSHRRATLKALSTALIEHKRIVTTQAKAKALRVYVEPLITRARDDNSHNRRQVFRHLQDKRAVTELFDEIAEKVGDRKGGYTRIVKLGQRHGDAASMAVIELVDYNDVRPEGSRGTKKATRRGRGRRSGAATAAVAATAPEAVDDAVDSADTVAAEAVDASDATGSGDVEAQTDVATADETDEAEASTTDTVDDVEAAAEEDASPESDSDESAEEGDDESKK